MLALLSVSRVVIGHCDDGAVVFHDDGGQFKEDPELLTEGDKEIEFNGQAEYCAGLSVGGGGCDSGLFDTAVVEGASSPIVEGDTISSVAFAVWVEEIRSVDFAI